MTRGRKSGMNGGLSHALGLHGRPHFRLRLRLQLVLGFVCATAIALAAPYPALAAGIVQIGGIDIRSVYTADIPNDTGIFTFSDPGPSGAPGLVDDAGGLPGLDINDLIFFEAKVNDTKCNAGQSAFSLSSNIKPAGAGACFVSNGLPADLRITDGVTTLLAFSLQEIEVTQAGTAGGPGDSDGYIVLGSFSVGSNKSILTLTGGSLAAAAGGIGSTAHLHIRMDTLLPALVHSSVPETPTQQHKVGYLENDFESGNGLLDAAVVWDLVIVPIPEPGTGSLLALGLVALAGARRVSRRR